jgi:ATP-dependent DNA helicase RecQ
MKLRVFKGKQLRTISKLHRERVEPWYEGQYRRTHLMVRYGTISSTDPEAGRQLVEDYFRLPRAEFDRRFGLSKREEKDAIRKPILPTEEQRILGDLNDAQKEVVNAEDAALVVVAGPGSGKTRSIVHRIAALVKIKQIPPERILVLAYNRNAVHELRVRLRGLVGPRASGLKVHTFHGLALSILGRTLGEVSRAEPEDPTHAGRHLRSPVFEELLREACDLLEHGDGAGGLPDSAVARRIRILGGLEYIFVDEYQDVDELQYRFIKLLAGLGQGDTRDAEEGEGEGPEEAERRVQIRLCVIGDDDQNLYAFRGASNRFLL